ncbi:MAG: VPA1262 family N-terminal domain-containing protein [Pseudomonadota bacterium]
MADRDDDLTFVKDEIARLTKDGVLGFYTHFEVTEVIAFRGRDAPPLNVFSVFVAEDRGDIAATSPEFLGPRITLKQARGWTFGVCRYLQPVSEILNALAFFQTALEWKPSGKVLNVGPLVAVPTQFISADTTVIVPWNNVLKNNFWNGSYVVEFADPDKAELKLFFDSPPLLQELSEQIQTFAPIQLASLSDRLGNLAFQIPITVLTATFAHQRLSGDVVVSLGWHPKAKPRKVRAVCDMQFDDTLTGYASSEVNGDSATIQTASGLGTLRAALWDEDNRVLLAATGSTAFIETIVTNMYVNDPEPRIFSVPSRTGGLQRIGLHQSNKIVVEARNGKKRDKWAKQRIYRDEAARLSRERRFVQYRPTGLKTAAHEAALKDLHFLLRRYGEDGAWLWDPYLTATDILETLFHCPHSGVELRALTAAAEIPDDDTEASENLTRHQAFAVGQRSIFDNAQSNWRGIRLEYRMRSGPSGWPFHDRFLIFPVKDGGAHAWSLGTSVNSFGTIHHILQKVDDGQLVMDAFAELWDQLDQPQHLILKKP